MKNISILGSLRADFITFYGFSALLAAGMMFTPLWEVSLLTMGILIFLDMGHAYSTLFRTYFRKQELNRSKVYLYAPIGLLLMMFLWSYYGAPYFWRFMLYMTFLHHVRQNHGLFRWYAKLENYQVNREVIHIHLMAIIPFLLFHFRDVEYHSLYHSTEFYFFNGGAYVHLAIALYAVYFFFNMCRMLFKLVKKEVGLGLAISYIYPAALNYICFLTFKHSLAVFLPLLTLHATTYFALMSHSINKLYPSRWSYSKITLMLAGIILAFVSIEYLFTDFFNLYSALSLEGNALLSLIASLSVLPNLMHFLIDSIIWKRGNPDFQLILKS